MFHPKDITYNISNKTEICSVSVNIFINLTLKKHLMGISQ